MQHAGVEILIVEDSMVEAELLRRTLDRADYRVRMAKNGREGLEAVRASRPALVVSDIRMPYMSGYELCREIKYDDALWNIPVILLTMLSEPEDIMEAINSGADSYIIKPFSETILLERIRSLLAMPLPRKRAEERRSELVEYNGKRHKIMGSSHQILNLLLSTYENTLAQNRELIDTRTRLNILNESLEAQVRERTAALAQSEEKFRSISSTALDAILMIDNDGRLLYWNPAAERIFGYRSEEALGRNVHDLLAPKYYATDFERGFAAFQETGKGEAIGEIRELEAIRKDGSLFPIELSVSALKLDCRWHAVGILRDITERKQAENELRLFRTLIDNSSDAIEVFDPATFEILDMNEKGCSDLGYTREEVLAMHVPDMDPGFESRDSIGEEIGRSGSALFEGLHRRKDGSTFPVEVSVKLVKLDKTYGLSIARDITERKQGENALRRANRALKALSACNAVLIHAVNEASLFGNMCRVIVEQGGYHFAWIGLVEHDAAKSVRAVAHAGFEAGYLDTTPMITWADTEAGRGPTGRAIRSGSPQAARDIRTDPHYEPWRADALKRGYASSLALPLRSGEEVFGVLAVYAAEADAFADEEVRLLSELAEDLAFGISTLKTRAERDKAVAGETEQAFRLRQALEETIVAIALTLEKRDPYTAGHQQRVSELAAAIAEEMGLPHRQTEGIRFGALIHDIGKVYVPSEILNRPGRLTELEFGLIKAHPEVGFDIVKDIHFPWPVAQMVLQHHERLDGSGYPRGLKADEIMLETRILSVADVVEAMAAHRPYRSAVGMKAALEELKRGRGTQYDPDVVDTCLRVIGNGFAFTRT